MLKNLSFLFVFLSIAICFSQTNINDLLVRRGVYLFEQKDYADAEKLLESVTADPSYAPIRYFILGGIYRLKGFEDSKKASSNYQNAIKYSTSLDIKREASINLCYVLIKNPDNVDQAIKIIDDLLTQYPKDLDVKYCYAMVYNKKGYIELMQSKKEDELLEAIRYFTKALGTRPELVGIANNIAVCYGKLAELYKSGEVKRCDYAKLGWSVLKEYWPKHHSGNIKNNRDWLFKLCPELNKDLIPNMEPAGK